MIAFLFLYGESGLVTRGIQQLSGMQEAPWRLTGVWAIIFVHAYTMYVYVFLFVSAGLERFDTTLDEAAAGLGASSWQRLRRVTLPLLTPALAGSMLLVFMTSLGSFSAPYVFGGGIRVLSTQIVASKLNGELGLAYVETTVLALSAVAGLLLFRWLEGKRKYTSSGKGAATRRVIRSTRCADCRGSPGDRHGDRSGAAAPDGRAGVVRTGRRVDDAGAAARVHARQLSPAVLTKSQLWRPIVNSVSMALIATAANVVVCFVAAYLIVLRQFSGRRLLEILVALPWAIPATAIALGLAATFNRNDCRIGARAARRNVLDSSARLLRPRHPSRCDRGRKLAAADGCVARGCSARARRIVVAHYAPGSAAGRATRLDCGCVARGGNGGWRVRRECRSLHARQPADLDGDTGAASRSSRLAPLQHTVCC